MREDPAHSIGESVDCVFSGMAQAPSGATDKCSIPINPGRGQMFPSTRSYQSNWVFPNLRKSAKDGHALVEREKVDDPPNPVTTPVSDRNYLTVKAKIIETNYRLKFTI
jgi:hypothetical protein